MPEMPSEARERPSEAVSARPGVPACPDWLRKAVADALGCSRVPGGAGDYCGVHVGELDDLRGWQWPCPEAARVADALAPVIEAREARAVVHELSAVCAWLITDPRPSSPVDIFDHIRALATVHYEVSDPDRFRDLHDALADEAAARGE